MKIIVIVNVVQVQVVPVQILVK